MKTITLKEAYSILEEASAVIIDDNTLTYPSLFGIEEDDDNEFLYLSWEDEDGYIYELFFREKDNKSIQISGSSMFLIDIEGEENQITILAPKNIERNV